MSDDALVIDAAWHEGWPAARLGSVQQSVLDEHVEADQKRVAGKCRKRLVRRIAIAGWAERQHLPEPLTGRCEQVDERKGARPEIADAEASRQ